MEPVVFLTGGTGFIGGAVLAELLTRHAPARVLVLARRDEHRPAAERVQASVARFLAPDELGACAHRCWALPGDVTNLVAVADDQTGARLPIAAYPDGEVPTLADVSHVIHLAANTSFRSVRTVRRVNILGTLALAHRFRRCGGLQRFLHVGTAYICGDHSSRVIFEDDAPNDRVNYAVEYTRSKAEAEALLAATAPELPLLIARPSVVVGHTRLGCGPSGSLFWLYRAADLLRRYLQPLTALEDVVPVDYVARALCALAFATSPKHRVYHVSAGLGSSVSAAELSAAFDAHHGHRPDDPIEVTDIDRLWRERDRLARYLGPGDEERFLQTLEIYFRFCRLTAEVFDNTRLLAEGIPAPPPFTSYLGRCVESSRDRSVYEQMRDDG
jgi:nucleoside-diphosphate-sugar epimerase